MSNIPIYRAKKIDSDGYVIGYYSPAYDIHHYIITHLGVDTKVDAVYQMSTDIHKIDSTTLAIHFPDMLDNQGNKIFASLNEDGKGGDIVDTTIGLRQNFITICLSSGVCVFTSDTSAIKNTPCKFILDYKHRGIKVIGIQE